MRHTGLHHFERGTRPPDVAQRPGKKWGSPRPTPCGQALHAGTGLGWSGEEPGFSQPNPGRSAASRKAGGHRERFRAARKLGGKAPPKWTMTWKAGLGGQGQGGAWSPLKVWQCKVGGGLLPCFSPSPQLTEHEHGTMAHHGGAMRSRGTPKTERTGRQNLLETRAAAQD